MFILTSVFVWFYQCNATITTISFIEIQNLLLFLSVKGNEDSIFSSFPRYCNPESIISEKVKFLQKMF